MANKEKLLSVREAVNDYRTAHSLLHSQGWDKNVPSKHVLLVNSLKNSLEASGFSNLDEFFANNELENYKEMGFDSHAAFNVRLKELDKNAPDDIVIFQGETYTNKVHTQEAQDLLNEYHGKWH